MLHKFVEANQYFQGTQFDFNFIQNLQPQMKRLIHIANS